MKIIILERAEKALKRIPRKDQLKIISAIDSLAKNPRPRQVKKLTAQPGFRLRCGNYRILYIVDQKSNAIFIARLAHRKDIYR